MLRVATIFHKAGATDHLEILQSCQLVQNVVLDAIGKERVFLYLR